jgi:hypothetical protein
VLSSAVVVAAVVAEVLGFAAAEVAPSASGGDLSAPCSGPGGAPHEPGISKVKNDDRTNLGKLYHNSSQRPQPPPPT